MSSNDGRPLEKKLTASFSLVGVIIVAQVVILKAQAVKFAEVPSEKRRVADRALARVVNDRSVIDLKTGRPVFVELQLGVAVAAVGLFALSHHVARDGGKREALVIGVELGSPSQTLINRAVQRLIAIGEINPV